MALSNTVLASISRISQRFGALLWLVTKTNCGFSLDNCVKETPKRRFYVIFFYPHALANRF